MKIKILRINPSVSLPKYAHLGDAAFDLCAAERTILNPGERRSIPTGLAFEIPDGYAGLIWDKSGLSHKYGLKTFGGVIDSGYRGEVMVGMMNFGDQPYVFEQNHKVAQMLIQKVEQAEISESDTLADSSRAAGGFGSTGK